MSETISFQLQAIENGTENPIQNATIQLENINLGQKLKTNDEGIASFEIESTQKLKPFRAKLIHDDYQEYPIHDRVLIPNALKSRDKPYVLRFRGKIWLLFNGESLSIMSGKDKILKTYTAYSGQALSPQEAQNLQQEHNYTRFVTYTDKGLFSSDETLYFCLDTEWQKQKDKGAIPEGTYYIDINALRDSWSIFSENKFGKNTRIYTDKDCTNTTESTTQRDNFYLHGGDKYGNAGGIDLAKNDTSFFNYLTTLKATHIYDSIYAKREEKCVIALVVEYGNGFEEVEKPYYIDSEGYLQGLNIVKYPITRLEFTLTNGFIPKAIVLHMTNSYTAKNSLAYWNNPKSDRVGTHFLIDTDGTIYQCASLHKYTQHIGNIRSKVELEKTWDTKEKVLIENIWKEKISYSARRIKVSNYEKTKSYPNRYPINSDSIGIRSGREM